jgi:hypothetical protein
MKIQFVVLRANLKEVDHSASIIIGETKLVCTHDVPMLDPHTMQHLVVRRILNLLRDDLIFCVGHGSCRPSSRTLGEIDLINCIRLVMSNLQSVGHWRAMSRRNEQPCVVPK